MPHWKSWYGTAWDSEGVEQLRISQRRKGEEKMKKRLASTLLAGAMVCSMVLTGCSGGDAEKKDTSPAEKETDTNKGKEQDAVGEAAALIDAIYVQVPEIWCFSVQGEGSNACLVYGD